jgi:hypothetical protein
MTRGSHVNFHSNLTMFKAEDSVIELLLLQLEEQMAANNNS